MKLLQVTEGELIWMYVKKGSAKILYMVKVKSKVHPITYHEGTEGK